MIYALYRGLTNLAAPLISRYLNKRLQRGKEHPTRFCERLGQATVARPAGALVWFHGASVGEAVSLLSLIEAVRAQYPSLNIMLTTGTVTSAALMEKRLPQGVIHQFVPVDRLPYVRGFLNHWKPDLAIWAESELWPNLICETHARQIPMALINARMSEKSLKTWRKLNGFAARLLGSFDLCLAQTEEDAQRYQELGAREVSCPGNLKYASGDLPVDEAELAKLHEGVLARPCWLAASTHAGEEILIGRVHQQIKASVPDVVSLIAPRHPERGDQIAADLRAQGLKVAQRSRGEALTGDCDIYLADTLGELGLFYRLAPIVFMGKSLEPLGGQNPLEAARLDCAMLCGPYMTNFAEIMTRFNQADAIVEVRDEESMATAVQDLLQNSSARKDLAKKAKDVALSEAAVLSRTMDGLAPLFQKAAGGKR